MSVYDGWMSVYDGWMSVYDECMQKVWMLSVYGECWMNVGVVDCKNNETMFVTLYMQIIMCDAIVQVFSKINCSNCILF